MIEKNVAFNVDGNIDENISCSLKERLEKLNGVIEVAVYTETKRVTVEFDEERLSEDTIKGIIEDAGLTLR